MSYDCIVIGVGGVGSGVLYHLARRGLRVLGLDRFGVAHDRGSSHGRSRIIRKAYFEHPDYVPLCERAYESWAALADATGSRLYTETGLLLVGPADGEAISGARLPAERYGVPIENLDRAAAIERFPSFRFPAEAEFVFEPRAGYLDVEGCVRTHVETAVARGAVFETDRVVDVSRRAGEFVVRTDRDEFRAESLIDCRGAYHDLPGGFEILRKVQLWFPTTGANCDGLAEMPIHFVETPYGAFYGLPPGDGATVKVAEHSGGEVVASPDGLDRSLHDEDVARVARFVAAHLPGVGQRPVSHAVCMYTMSPDGHFVVGASPGEERRFVAMGLSGHGFKFAGVLGEALADLVVDGRTDVPIEFLSPRRFDRTSRAD